jgi:drug/metabolite transporter (DMT)-like permease
MVHSTKAHIGYHNNLYGILFILLNALALSLIYVVMKIITKDISSHLTVFLYKAMILICILPWCFIDGIKGIKTKRIWMHASRGFLSVSGSLCLFYALKHIDLVDATAIGYLEQVVLVIIGILYFKEPASKTKIVTIILSFVGAVIVVVPVLGEFSYGIVPNFICIFFTLPDFIKNFDYNSYTIGHSNYYYIFVILSIMFWATNSTVIKILGKTEKSKVQLFYVNLFSCLIAFPLAFMKWEYVGNFGSLEIKLPATFFSINELGLKSEHFKYLALLAVCYFTHSVAFFLSLKYAELSTVIPFDYTRLILIGVLGYLVLGEVPSQGSYSGYLMIIISGVCLIRSERRKHNKLENQRIIQLKEEMEHV